MATLTIDETSGIIGGSLDSLRESGAIESSIVDDRLFPGGLGIVDTMQRYGVDELDVGDIDRSDPESTLQSVFGAAQSEFDTRGIPHPDMSFYQGAATAAQQTGTPVADVLADVNGSQPLGMQNELMAEADFSVTPTPLIGAQMAGPLGASAAVQATGELDAEPIDYQEYDVHIVAYPLKTIDLPFTDTDIVMRDMHSFLIVTEPGMDPTLAENVVLGMRGGPDDNTAWLSGSSESSVGDVIPDAPPGSRTSGDGDLYVQGTDAAKADLDTPHVTVVQTTRMTGNLDEMREDLEGLAEIINEADLNYVAVDATWSGMNCNVVSGDGFELLTGQEPVNPYERWGLDERRLPGLEEDALNYEETEYEASFD